MPPVAIPDDDGFDLGTVVAPPTAANIQLPCECLVATLSCLDQLGLGQSAVHVSLALDRLDEIYPLRRQQAGASRGWVTADVACQTM